MGPSQSCTSTADLVWRDEDGADVDGFTYLVVRRQAQCLPANASAMRATDLAVMRRQLHPWSIVVYVTATVPIDTNNTGVAGRADLRSTSTKQADL